MRKSKFTDAQIAYVLRQAEEGTSVAEVCRKASIAEATVCNCRKSSVVRCRLKVQQANNRFRVDCLETVLSNAMKRTPGSRSSWLICCWVKRCCRTLSSESSKACSQTRTQIKLGTELTYKRAPSGEQVRDQHAREKLEAWHRD